MSMMHPTKPALESDDKAALLIRRVIIGDESAAREAFMGTTRDELLLRWQALGQKAFDLALRIAGEADPRDSDPERGRVKLWAFCLLCRTVNHFDAMQLLLQHNLIVESRTLVRCCYENLFRMGYLVKEREAAVKEWLRDWDASTKTVGRDLLSWTKRQAEAPDVADEFETFMEELMKKESKKGASFETEAGKGGMADAYITYRMLSRDAAHPNATVLQRHTRVESDDSVSFSKSSIWWDANEEIDTWDLGCKALIFVCGGTNELLALQHGGQVKGLLDEHEHLSLRSLALKA